MLTLTFILGYFSTVLIFTGIMLRILNFELGTPVSFLGFFLFIFVFVPMILSYFWDRVRLTLVDKIRWFLALASGLSFIVGFGFKMLHYPGANIFQILGILLFTFGVLPFFFYDWAQRTKNLN
jgi:hypothetical protein